MILSIKENHSDFILPANTHRLNVNGDSLNNSAVSRLSGNELLLTELAYFDKPLVTALWGLGI